MIILDMKKYGKFCVLIGTHANGIIIWREVLELNSWVSESYAFSKSDFITLLTAKGLGWPPSISAYFKQILTYAVFDGQMMIDLKNTSPVNTGHSFKVRKDIN